MGTGTRASAPAPAATGVVLRRVSDVDRWSGGASPRAPSKWSVRPAALVLCAFTALCCGLLIWGAGRGYELTDEGLVLLHYADASKGMRAYGALVSSLFGGAVPDVHVLRLMRLALVAGSAIALAEGARRWLLGQQMARGGLDGALTLHCAVFMATAVTYAASPQVLSYNTLNHACLVASAGLLLCGLAQRDRDGSNWPAFSCLLALAGSAGGLQVFVKFPSGLACAGLTTMVLVGHRLGGGGRGVHRALASYAAGASLSALLFFTCVESPASWFGHFTEGVSTATSATHSPGRILGRYWWSLQLDLVRVPTRYAAALALAFTAGAWSAQRRTRPVGWLRLGPVVVGLAALACYASGAWSGALRGLAAHTSYRSSVTVVADPSHPLQALLWMLAAAAAGDLVVRLAARLGGWMRSSESTGRVGAWRRRVAPVAVLLFLLLLPLAGSFGTNTRLLSHAAHHLAPWTIVVAWLATRMARRAGVVWHPRVILLLFAAVVQLQVIIGFALLPWRLPGRLAEQTVAVSGSRPLESVRVDATSARFFSELVRALRDEGGMRPGDPLLPMFDLPGLVQALDGRYPTTIPEIGGNWDAGRLRYLQEVPDATRDRMFLLVESIDEARAHALLDEAGYGFPDDYVELTCCPNPYTGAWLTVYAPRARMR